MDCTCNEVRFFLLQSQVDRLERELRVMQAQIGIHLHDFTVASTKPHCCWASRRPYLLKPPPLPRPWRQTAKIGAASSPTATGESPWRLHHEPT